MKIKILYLLLFLFVLTIKSYGQSVQLNYTEQPLNEILIKFNSDYNVEVSINSNLSESCLVTIEESFISIEVAIMALAEYCELEVIQIKDVYTFRNKSSYSDGDQSERRNINEGFYLYQGKIVDGISGEPLPYASVETEYLSMITDEDGRFSFKAASQDAQIRFRYLGYHQADTVVSNENQLEIKLKRGSIDLLEVVISAASTVFQATTGELAGQTQLNDVSTTLTPGNSNNMIFNHLRLYPGIMASGESLSDYIIWGSYAGQNQVIFDGITIFNSYGINDDIGRVNPLLIKNIEVNKGGYNVEIGDRIGGVVLIDGKSGNRENIDGEISVSNEMANAYLSFPLFNKSSTLQIAGRKSYYQLLNWNTIIDRRTGNFIIPEYDYGDVNFKFTSSFKNNDQMEISAVASRDKYSEMLERKGMSRYSRELDVSSLQIGSSFKYLRIWKKGGISVLKFAQSHYDSDLNSTISIRQDFDPVLDRDFNDNWENPINEYSLKVSHDFPASRHQDIQLGLGYVRNQYEFRSKSSISLNDISEHVDRLSVYAKDDISVAKHFNLQVGLKVDIPFSDYKPYFQPRLDGQVNLPKSWRFNFAWGMYNQFVSKTPVIDMEGNRLVIWQTADGENIPVLSSMHNVLGFAYLTQKLEVSVEGYFRTTDGMSRFIENRDSGEGFFREGMARAYGMDAFLKTRFINHEFWVSYSLGKVEEQYSEVVGYREAPQSQRHELKAALVLKFKPVQISITNVYGNGFPNTTIRSDELQYVPYNRLDLAFQYGVDIKKIRLEVGFSILNLLNRENIRLNQFASFPDGTTSSTSGIPFTPSIYLNFKF